MIFLRMGPRLLFIRTKNELEIRNFFVKVQKGKEGSFQDAFEEASEDSTLVFITAENLKKTRVEDAKHIILINRPASFCLSRLINSHISEIVERVDMGPSTLIMRIPGGQSKVSEEIEKIYEGKNLSIREAIDQGEDMDTILFLTDQALSKSVGNKAILKSPLLIPKSGHEIYKTLRNEGILLITRGLENRKWYELRINIYDFEGKYTIHYDRLSEAFKQLEVGMVLEEGWTKDHALALFSVVAYQVKLFTFFPPEDVKKILIGLEYSESGRRMVDFDLYYRNKKVAWGDIERDRKRKSKVDQGIRMRKELFSRLNSEGITKLGELEEKLKN